MRLKPADIEPFNTRTCLYHLRHLHAISDRRYLTLKVRVRHAHHDTSVVQDLLLTRWKRPECDPPLQLVRYSRLVLLYQLKRIRLTHHAGAQLL